MSEYRVVAAWQEVRELWFDSLDEAAEWAHKLLGDEPNATVTVCGEDFSGGWFIPTENMKRTWQDTVREREATSPNIGTAA